MFVRRSDVRRPFEDEGRSGDVLNTRSPSRSASAANPPDSANAGLHVRVTTLAQAAQAEHNEGHSGAFDVVDLALAALLIGIAVAASYFSNRSWSVSSSPGTLPYTELGSQSRSPAIPVRAHADNSRPEPVVVVPAFYTEQARYAHFHGRVYVVITVSRQGTPSHVEITAPIPFDLEPAIRQAVAKWHFRPAIRDGEPVDATAVFEVPLR